MTNKEKFLSLVSTTNDETQKGIQFREENKIWLRESKSIAFKVLKALRAQSLSQKDLAGQMNVSPQYINKLVKGKENFTLETLVKLQEILDIPLLAGYYENRAKQHTIQMFGYKAPYQKGMYTEYNPSLKKVGGYE